MIKKIFIVSIFILSTGIFISCSDSKDDAGDEVKKKCEESSCGENEKCDDSSGEIKCECKAGYHSDNDACVKDTECKNTTCGGHGTCDASSGEIKCTCNKNFDSAKNCSECKDGYHQDGDKCVVDEKCENDTCNGHGDCSVSDGKIKCTCKGNFDSTNNCSECKAGYHEDGDKCVADTECKDTTCSGHGTCDASSGEIKCTCSDNFDSAKNCSECKADYHKDGDKCVADEKCDNNTCNGHGDCKVSDGKTNCTCKDNFDSAKNCKECKAGFVEDGGKCIEKCTNDQFMCDDKKVLKKCESEKWVVQDTCSDTETCSPDSGECTTTPVGDTMCGYNDTTCEDGACCELQKCSDTCFYETKECNKLNGTKLTMCKLECSNLCQGKDNGCSGVVVPGTTTPAYMEFAGCESNKLCDSKSTLKEKVECLESNCCNEMKVIFKK